MIAMIEITKEREDVWYELSSLFLDTELTDEELLTIARKISATEFSVAELLSIMEDEVAPILHSNLHLVAGQWGLFDREKEVLEPIRARIARIPDVRKNGWAPFAYLRRKFHMIAVNDDWQKVLSHIRQEKNEPGEYF